MDNSSVQESKYVSLRDVPPPPALRMSPIVGNSSNWHDYDLPITNSLVKVAALAYLKPMPSPPVEYKGFFGCLAWINDVVFKPVKEMLKGGGVARDQQQN
ncbi:hypothetical protein ACFE04_011553 [Oxalis oulophora]